MKLVTLKRPKHYFRHNDFVHKITDKKDMFDIKDIYCPYRAMLDKLTIE